MTRSVETIAVVIPTRNRPEKLNRCLSALQSARDHAQFSIVVCDSSADDAMHASVAAVCAAYADLKLVRHSGKNVAAARNTCARSAMSDIIVNVDDDIYVEPEAIARIVARYRSWTGFRVVAGSVRWGDLWSQPIKMRPIGYGRDVADGEKPDFLVGAFFVYSTQLALAKPWNEDLKTSDDRFMGALLRSHKVPLDFEPEARAIHDHLHTSYGLDHQRSHIYANLFDAAIANPNPFRMFTYEVLGFVWGLRLALRQPGQLSGFIEAWLGGHTDLLRDWSKLQAMVRSPLPLATDAALARASVSPRDVPIPG